MTKHIHHDIICEWAADTSKVVQVRQENHQSWEDTSNNTPSWNPTLQYRIKPEKKPDHTTECKVLGIYKSILWNSTRETVPDANLRLTFDGETGKLIKAEVLA